MNPEQQRIAIGEACGWKLVTDNPEYEPYWEDPKGNMVAVSNGVHRFPDYLNDLNAMHGAVKTLPQNIKPRYFACLCAVVSGAISLNGYSEATEATAAQRAEAFLRTLDLWLATVKRLSQTREDMKKGARCD